MKKRILMAVVLGVSLSVGAAFAQHPGGLGIGAVIQYGGSWDDIGHTGLGGVALSLKVPSMPIYWGINVDLFQDHWFGLTVTGDKYIYDQALVPDISLGWFLGLGGYGSLHVYTGTGYDAMGIGVGIRVPIGLSWILAKQFELFLDIAPSIGIGIGIGDGYGTEPHQLSPLWIDGGWAGDFGFRVWLK
ncbi:hypothetical protein AGMMS49928_01940 [Spirochaetia bacterium]|nr:hypothetical protein AGMMS49928_01940 [Spirochaetia bacterium]